MTALSMHTRGNPQHYVLSWMFSLLFHGFAFSMAILFVTDLHLAPQPEAFKWNVSLVESATPSESQNQPVPPQPVVQTIKTVQQVVHQVVRTVTPVVQHTMPQPEQVVTRTAQTVALAQQMAETPTETTVAAVVQPTAKDAAASAVPTAPAAEPSAVRELTVRTGPAPRRDYGWLAEALWSKVERLKRYPPMARMNRWQGKVVLKAVVKADGSVENLTVVESSGYAVLDQDALEVVRRASPLALKHDLGQPQVTVQIPISYSLR